jgi:hypothetical protein
MASESVGDIVALASEGACATFASPKSNTFTTPSAVTLIFAGLEVAVNDTLLVRGLERHRDLPRIVASGLDRKRPFHLGAIHQLHHDGVLLCAVNRRLG